MQAIGIHEEAVPAHEGGHGHRRFADIEKQVVGFERPVFRLRVRHLSGVSEGDLRRVT